ncbi:MAG: hypothetical protein COX48_01410 [bacterium (Candidatus Stahlbacteria) CG23_combo_of_CG06-09_8_20_14_all_34_7]|nr:MAG: hypothetical protein COX48_01410 [bacterium (Candidatus Stahlbacteria) CG23_combo_of_CG06-09_8_20_14_all_34_7]
MKKILTVLLTTALILTAVFVFAEENKEINPSNQEELNREKENNNGTSENKEKNMNKEQNREKNREQNFIDEDGDGICDHAKDCDGDKKMYQKRNQNQKRKHNKNNDCPNGKTQRKGDDKKR